MLCRHALFFSLYKTSICLKSLYKEKIAFYSICTGRIVQLTATTKGFFYHTHKTFTIQDSLPETVRRNKKLHAVPTFATRQVHNLLVPHISGID